MRSFRRAMTMTLCLALGLAAVSSAQSQVFTYTGGLQSLTVPPGIFQAYILADGAKGGNAQGSGAVGGPGGRIEAIFNVTPGAVLQIVVGGRGTNTTNNNGGGGGGASYVTVGTGYADFATPLIVAGGGGGGSRPISAGIGPGGAGGEILGGTGLGGSGGSGAGGGGIIGDGQLGFFGGGAGIAAINGSAGGAAHAFAAGGAGGYGGGAGAGGREGAGGGGYTGGRGAPSSGNARGGSSFANCTAVTTNTPGGAPGPDGQVIVSFIAPATYAHTGSLQNYIVPLGVNEVTITAAGGKGGNAQGAGATGGSGGTIQATLPVAPGSVLQIIVGGRGRNTTNNNGGGGGGASYVTVGAGYPDFATPLIVAGGGGGGSRPISAGIGPGGPGGAILGGTGLGGNGGSGAGGGGIIGNGQISFFGGGAGIAAINGSAFGAAHAFATGGAGGYGGGAGAGGREGAGGGGYTGGRGAPGNGNADGGTSFAAPSATNVGITPGGNSNADGSVTIVPVIPNVSGVLSVLTDVTASMAAPSNLTAVTPKIVAVGQVMHWVVNQGTSPCTGVPLILLANVGAEASSEALTPGIPGFNRFHNLSVPTGTALILGDGFGVGSIFGIPVGPIGPNLVGDPPAGIALPAGLPPGLEIRLQAASVCPCSIGIAVSNECSFITQ